MTKTKNKKVLLIEDEPSVCNLLKSALQPKGFEVVMALNGQEGLKMAQEHIPDLIILDLCLPKLSGEEVCKWIREEGDERIRNIPIVMLTGKATEADQIIGKVIGANAYLTKPFDINRVLEEVSNFV